MSLRNGKSPSRTLTLNFARYESRKAIGPANSFSRSQEKTDEDRDQRGNYAKHRNKHDLHGIAPDAWTAVSLTGIVP